MSRQNPKTARLTSGQGELVGVGVPIGERCGGTFDFAFAGVAGLVRVPSLGHADVISAGHWGDRGIAALIAGPSHRHAVPWHLEAAAAAAWATNAHNPSHPMDFSHRRCGFIWNENRR